MGSAAIQSGHGNYNRVGHLSLREEGWVEGSKVGVFSPAVVQTA